MKRADKVIITCAVTGAIHTPSMSPYLPITPAQIAAESVAAAEAGAAVIHLHARDPETGKPDQTPERFLEFLPSSSKSSWSTSSPDVAAAVYCSVASCACTSAIRRSV